MVQDITTPVDLIVPVHSGRMSDHLVRVGHLKALQKQNDWTESELARQCGKSPQQVHSWYKNKRNIGERLARELEERLGLPRYALDERYGVGTVRLGEVSAPSQGGAPQVTKRAREVPILSWVDIDKLLTVENATLKQRAMHLETYAIASPKAKFVQMPDDSMSPGVALGDHLLFDPQEAPRAGDVVLVRVPSGEHFVRVFRPRTAYVFEAAPVNDAYVPLGSQADGAVVVGVMVEHRSYRRGVSP